MSEFTYIDALKLIPEARPRKFPEPEFDPILEHCIKLRKFQDEMRRLILLSADLKEVYDDSEREPILKSLPPIPELPELVTKTPDEKQKNLTLEIELSNDSVIKLVSKRVACVLYILGYTDISSHLLLMLTKVVTNYVKSLAEIMVKLLPEDGSISVDLLETALQEKGIHGIEELYLFYTQRIVQFHHRLYLKCESLSDDLKNNLRKPDPPPKQNITESSVDECCATNAEKENVNMGSIEDPINQSLNSGALAEGIFMDRLQRKSVSFAPQTAFCEETNYKDLFLTKPAIDENKTVENAADSESYFSVKNVFTENTVSSGCKDFDSNASKELTSRASKNSCNITGLFSNFHYFSDKTSDVSNNIVFTENEVAHMSSICYSNDELTDNSTINVDIEKEDNKNAIGSELNYESSKRNNIVSAEKKYYNNNAISSKFIDESSDQDDIIVEEKVTDEDAIGSKFIDESSDQDDIVEEKVTDEDAVGSKFIDESSDQDDIVEEKVTDEDAIGSKFIDESSDLEDIAIDEEKVTDENATGFDFFEKSSERNSIVSDAKKYFDNNATISEAIYETSDPYDIVIDEEKYTDESETDKFEESPERDVIFDTEKTFYKNAYVSELNDDSLDHDSYIVPDKLEAHVKNAVGSKSYSNLGSTFSENIVSLQCVSPISDLDGELDKAVSKCSTKISAVSNCNFSDKLLQNRKGKKRFADFENLDSLCDKSTGNRKKKAKIMKHKKISEKCTNIEAVPCKIKHDLNSSEHSSSRDNYNLDGNMHKKYLGTTYKENGSFNFRNSKASSLAHNSNEIDDTGDISSSSENETEQIWISSQYKIV